MVSGIPSAFSKLLLIAIVLAPIPVIFFASGLTNSFSPPKSNVQPIQALRYGAAYFSCDEPFRSAIKSPQALGVEGDCKLLNGNNVYAARFDKSVDLEARNWRKQGLYIEFDTMYNRRLAGREIIIEITASCIECSTPIDAAFTTNGFGNSGWVPLNFTDTPTTESFRYIVKNVDVDTISTGPALVLNPHNESAKSILHIHSVSIFRAPKNG